MTPDSYGAIDTTHRRTPVATHFRASAFWFAVSSLVLTLCMAVDSHAANAPSEPASSTQVGPYIDSGVTASLAKGRTPDLIVRMRGRPDLSAAHGMSWRARGRYVYETLTGHAEQAQANIRLQLEQRHGRLQTDRGYRVLWIDNSLLVPSADAELLATLQSSADIESIRLNAVLPNPFEPLTRGEPSPGTPGTNIDQVKAPDVWALGYRGEGMVVGSIDSGVRHTHQSLVEQYRGNTGSGFVHHYNWYDPYENTPQPRRNGSHGTHTLGTMIGDDGNGDVIGVAPGAKWITCVGSALDGYLYLAGLIECGQFLLAPTDTQGNLPQPDLRPVAVNNSWSSCELVHNPFYAGVIDAWIAAGIVPVFSNGNNSNCGFPAPPGLNTVGNPARSGKVLGIGSTGNNDGQYADHSNQGPTDNINPGWPSYPDHRGFPNLKPNVSAPGVAVRSAGDENDGAFLLGTGTSMSSPHVTGLVALMWQAGPCLMGDYANTGSILMDTADAVPYVTGSPSDGPGHVPNQATGWGEINALEAVQAAIAECGPRGAVTGTVTDDDSGKAIEGARLNFRGARDLILFTDSDGRFSRELPSGSYDLDIDAFGYFPVNQQVMVPADASLTLDLELEATPRHLVSGRVVHRLNPLLAWPVHARIHVVQPGGSAQTWSDPGTGAFAIALPSGHNYTLTAIPTVPGYLPESLNILALDGDIVAEINVPADTIACEAPGYAGGGGLYEDFEAGVLPPGWTRTTDRPGFPGWLIGDDLRSPYFIIPPHGRYAASNDDAHPINSIARQERLITPPVTIEDGRRLRYASAYSGGYGMQASVELSTDGGQHWTTISTPTATGSADAPEWRDESVDLSNFSGQTVQLAFRTDDQGDWSSGWAIDDVQISPPCQTPPNGAVLIGKVLDSALAPDGVNGATVSVEGGAGTVTAASEDPALGDGWYTLFLPTGLHSVTVHSASFGELARDIEVPTAGSLRQDFDLHERPDSLFVDGFEKGVQAQ